MDDAAAARLETSLTYLRDRFSALRVAGPIRGAMVDNISMSRKTLDELSAFIGGPRENALPLASRITTNWLLSERWRRAGSVVRHDLYVYVIVWEDGLDPMTDDDGLITYDPITHDPMTIDYREVFFHCEGGSSAIATLETISEDASAISADVARRLGVSWHDMDEAQCDPAGATWWWLIFHAAAARLPGFLLRLSRCHHRLSDGTFAVMEVRDMVEASIMLIDAALAVTPVADKKPSNEEPADVGKPGSKPAGNGVGRPAIDPDFDRAIRREWLAWARAYDGDGRPTIEAFIEWRITRTETEERNGERFKDKDRARMAADWDDAIERGRKQIERIKKAAERPGTRRT